VAETDAGLCVGDAVVVGFGCSQGLGGGLGEGGELGLDGVDVAGEGCGIELVSAGLESGALLGGENPGSDESVGGCGGLVVDAAASACGVGVVAGGLPCGVR
jgi:hypothetical protein